MISGPEITGKKINKIFHLVSDPLYLSYDSREVTVTHDEIVVAIIK